MQNDWEAYFLGIPLLGLLLVLFLNTLDLIKERNRRNRK
jgi:hypothetical protein